MKSQTKQVVQRNQRIELLHLFRWSTHTCDIHTHTFDTRTHTETQRHHATHTCSEISYRITDVECIVRTKTLQLNLAGVVERSVVKTYAKEIIQLVLMQLIHPQMTMEVQIAKNRAKKELEDQLVDVPVLGLAGRHF